MTSFNHKKCFIPPYCGYNILKFVLWHRLLTTSYLFTFFEAIFFRITVGWLQQDVNLDHQSRRCVRWPLNQHRVLSKICFSTSLFFVDSIREFVLKFGEFTLWKNLKMLMDKWQAFVHILHHVKTSAQRANTQIPENSSTPSILWPRFRIPSSHPCSVFQNLFETIICQWIGKNRNEKSKKNFDRLANFKKIVNPSLELFTSFAIRKANIKDKWFAFDYFDFQRHTIKNFRL